LETTALVWHAAWRATWGAAAWEAHGLGCGGLRQPGEGHGLGGVRPRLRDLEAAPWCGGDALGCRGGGNREGNPGLGP
jgi:hypothetical protein